MSATDKIVFEGAKHWVLRVAMGYEVYRNGPVASECVARYGRGQVYLTMAIEECHRRDRESTP